MNQPYNFFLEYLTLYPEARKTANISRCMQAAFRYYGYITRHNQWDEYKFLEGYTIQYLDRALREVKKDNGWQDSKSKELEKSYREMHSQLPRNEASITKGINAQSGAQNLSETKIESNTGNIARRLSHVERMELIKKEVSGKIRL